MSSLYKNLIKKQHLFFLISFLVTPFLIQAEPCVGQDGCSRTFFRPRPFSQDSVLELAMSAYFNHHQLESSCCPCPWLSLEVTPFFYQSTNSKDLASYFFPRCRSTISIAQNNESDVSSRWLGLVGAVDAPYNSVLTMCPKRKAYGAAFRAYVSAENLIEGCLSRLWASIFVPLVHVRHELNLQERVGNPGIVEVDPNITLTNAITALNNPAFRYGRFPVCPQTKTGVDDVQVKLGIDLWHDECNTSGVYFVSYIPSDHQSHACTVFEPTLGSGDHGGIGAGWYVDYTFWQECDASLAFLADIRYAYFFSNVELRSFDLLNSDWSRYMTFANEGTPNNFYRAINFLTFPVEVTPRSTFELWAALHYASCDWHCEVGYDFWFRQAEKLCISCDPFVQQVSIFDISAAQIIIMNPTSASTATIRQAEITPPNNPTIDAEFTPLTIQRLNRNSAAHPRTYTSKVYGSLGKDFNWFNHDLLLSVGGSYEHAHNRAALSQFGVWVKAVFNF